MSEYNLNYLDFEQPLLEIENKIASIKTSASTSQGDRNKIDSLNKELEKISLKYFLLYLIGKFLKSQDILYVLTRLIMFLIFLMIL